MERVTPTYTAQIYVAGDINTARHICREYVYRLSECVTVEPVEFIYKGGVEAGVRVGFINYPRLPQPEDEIFDRAANLADLLMKGLVQHSYSIVTADKTVFFSRREDAA